LDALTTLDSLGSLGSPSAWGSVGSGCTGGTDCASFTGELLGNRLDFVLLFARQCAVGGNGGAAEGGDEGDAGNDEAGGSERFADSANRVA
jgi:hypothetical protein